LNGKGGLRKAVEVRETLRNRKQFNTLWSLQIIEGEMNEMRVFCTAADQIPFWRELRVRKDSAPTTEEMKIKVERK
jgi:hypothetical protein